MRIKKEDTCALIIDFQEKLVPVMQNKERMIRNTLVLLKGLEALGVPMIVTEQYKKGLGNTICSVEEIVRDALHMEKMHFSCILDKAIKEKIKNLNKKYVIVAGIETHICVLQTVIDLLEEGFIPVVIENCTSTRIIENKKQALKRMLQEGALISTTESILFELLHSACDPEFKIISNYIKGLK